MNATEIMQQEAFPQGGVGKDFANHVLDYLPAGVYVTDTQRRIVFWSQGAERITGWTAEDVCNRSCNDNILVHCDKDDHPLCGKAHCPLHRSMVTNTTSTVPMIMFAQSKEGARVPVRVTVTPLRDDAGKVIGGIEVFHDLSDDMTELRRALAIQRRALKMTSISDPRIHVRVKYQPSDIVGGDFYRCEAIDENRYAVCIADVTGHGIAAALYTMQLRALWDSHRDLLAQPGAFLREMNRDLCELFREDHYFVSAWYGVVDLAADRLRYVNAGHPPALVYGRRGQPTLLPSSTLVLGMMDDADFDTSEIALGRHDVLLLYTDGATEVFDADRSQLGEEGLLEMLETEGYPNDSSVLDNIETRLLVYSNRIRLADDLTLIEVRRNG